MATGLVYPMALSRTVSGETTTESATCATVTSAVPVTDPAVADSVVVPGPAAITVTSVVVSSVATSVSAMLHTGVTPVTTMLPSASYSSAMASWLSPMATKVICSGLTAMESTRCATVTTALSVPAPPVARTTVSPLATAVTRPTESTMAMSVSALSHARSGPATGKPLASTAEPARRVVSPSASTVALSGVTSTPTTTCSTVALTVALTPSASTVTVAVPFPTDVITPVSAVTTSVSELVQLGSGSAMGAPPGSHAPTVRTAAAPSASNPTLSGDTAIESTRWSTVTSALPVTVPSVAVIRVVPGATPVTTPEPSTVATSVSSLAHANVAGATVNPLASCGSAASWTVPPSASIVSAAGETTTVSTTWLTVRSRVPDTSSAVAVTCVVPSPVAVINPASSTVTTSVSALAHEMTTSVRS